ncbi:MAG: 6-phosphogluconate dehydrogenase (decarboxylating) [Candidatus Ryanbacteria bacterium RIFCSPHIGHO2_02_FULL_45_43]|uniref:6-phosphogluconate dehydrogenase (Decarboxylating) n=1 Tax=Candidatus Ryanbacteria bacterium RIFCSPHIGHO2_01_45_13 TaxID=1802112 RepID=A0A1G2FZ55_9BACT|nr:MAG: 6-phosphogluconate dehydrogenase (decarboxylating) [Candidatus Ryanbacteria bacterium RIFCSPHIGHO2_01_FULL_44_130]OGZ43349.1 MAG: 6-phosphogluconate dehydrogenase (decarboxylating) [Candidatus Ryanbacteria bacterium RIFCSPHIGHO2_01_45_13]OGZ48927.1 MAG: 6-phosphogluconate dehydrogenase (decarboxylating) [Candidatus Ryanbacteria bacterium RIFCSPHIGHO2_02_FULL_45_43]OGZ50896.1 MAG: 6-phosphogluconate dehydrogenase (decarboxylating) [Candidatus Ryanbacteria bacterium RIFCSPHIGHO2_12_FULL_44
MMLGYIGLGKMGKNMVERLIEKGHDVVVFDSDREQVEQVAKLGAKPARSLSNLVATLSIPRLVWLMVPQNVVDAVLKEIVSFLGRDDTMIDGGNSFFKESVRRANEVEAQGVNFLDVGVSGGPRGARNGACVMIGGQQRIFERFERLFRDIATEGGYIYAGPSGSGHFVKMVHNGIEYGMMQALAEGFTVMKQSPFHLHLADVAEVYNHHSVIESRLVGWLKEAFHRHGEDLAGVSGSVVHTGEGLWTVETAKEMGISVPIIEGSLRFREDSKQRPSYTGKILSALRNQFGWHDISEKKQL